MREILGVMREWFRGDKRKDLDGERKKVGGGDTKDLG